ATKFAQTFNSLSPGPGFWPCICFVATRSEISYPQPKSARFTGPDSSILTCTSVSIDSQIRGGANIKSGPISRISAFCVDASSGKETVSPCANPHATASICSPIHANGRSETYRSLFVIGSASAKCSAIDSKFLWDSSANLGFDVVPEVVQITAVSVGLPAVICSSNHPGCFLPQVRPLSSISVNSTKSSSVYCSNP